MIISNVTKNITEYMNLGKEIYIPPVYGCNHCGYEGRLHRHGYYHRNVITKYAVTTVAILRLKCPSCKKTEGILPSFLIPYYQYSLDTILDCLYQSFVFKKSYSRISGKFNGSNSDTLLTSSNIYSFKKRMKGIVSIVNAFFSNFDEFYYDMDQPTAKSLLEKIYQFKEHAEDFNLSYFRLMPRYFFSKG